MDILKHPHLYLRLNTALLKACTPQSAEEFTLAYQKTSAMYSLDFLNGKAKNYVTKIQLNTRLFVDFLVKAGKPMHGIAMIAKAVKVLRQSNEQVSSLNTSFAKLCLKARCLQHALTVIEHPITSVLPGTNPLEIAIYNYYRGMIYMGLERYTEAIECFRKVLSQPTAVIH